MMGTDHVVEAVVAEHYADPAKMAGMCSCGYIGLTSGVVDLVNALIRHIASVAVEAERNDTP